MHNRFVTAGVVLLVSLTGCQSARYVVREADHGIVAVPDDSPRHLSEAEELMREHFPDGYRIVREEAVAIGEASREDPQPDLPSATPGSRPVGPTQRADARRASQPQTEWRITYFRTQPPSPSSSAVAAADVSTPAQPGESLFSTAGIIEPASNRN